MKMVDSDGDGKISLSEFEEIILRSLKNAGFEVYEWYDLSLFGIFRLWERDWWFGEFGLKIIMSKKDVWGLWLFFRRDQSFGAISLLKFLFLLFYQAHIPSLNFFPFLTANPQTFLLILSFFSCLADKFLMFFSFFLFELLNFDFFYNIFFFLYFAF